MHFYLINIFYSLKLSENNDNEGEKKMYRLRDLNEKEKAMWRNNNLQNESRFFGWKSKVFVNEMSQSKCA